MKSIRKNFLLTGHLEGVSYLLLLFIAMPLKYLLNEPLYVRILGSVHGFLFIAFILILIKAWSEIPLTITQCIKAFLLSLLPFGTFFLHKILNEEVVEEMK